MLRKISTTQTNSIGQELHLSKSIRICLLLLEVSSYCKPHVRDVLGDILDFVLKIKSLSFVPSTSILVTVDVTSLYTNINHEECADACYKKLKTRKNKTVPSNTLQSCTLLILKSNIFRLCSTLHLQKRGQLVIMQIYSQTCSKHHF